MGVRESGRSFHERSLVFVFSCMDVFNVDSFRNLLPGSTHDPPVCSSAEQSVLCPVDGEIRSLRVRHGGDAGNGVGVTYTVRVNGVDVDMAVSVPTGAAGNSGTATGAIAVAAGDRLYVRVSRDGDLAADTRTRTAAVLEVVQRG